MFKNNYLFDFLTNNKNLKNQLEAKEQQLIKHELKLKSYINKISEQQAKTRILRFLIDSIRQSLELDDVFQTIVNKICSIIDVDRCSLAIYDEENKSFSFKAECLSSSKMISLKNLIKIHRISDSLLELMKNVNTPYLLKAKKGNDIYNEYCFIDSTEVNSVLLAPITYDKELLGILIVENFKDKKPLNDVHIEMLGDISNQIAIAIKHAFLYSKAQVSTRLKSEFLASMSHELRTPLNGIISFAELMSISEYNREKQLRFLKNISKSGYYLLNIINDILDLSKIESNKEELACVDFNSKITALEIIETLQIIAKKKNIIIHTNLEDSFVCADKNRFRQILINIINNAIKFSYNDSIINITSYVKNADLYFEVQDEGIGLSDENRTRIFEKFTQVDSVHTRYQEGSGLGLAIVKKIIEMHKGEISYNSNLDKGTTFWFRLPNASSLVRNNNSML